MGGSRRQPIELKGLSHPALRVVVRDPSAEAIVSALAALRPEDPAGFEWQPAIVDLSALPGDATPDLEALCVHLRELKLHPVAVAGGSDAIQRLAETLQLGWLSGVAEPRRSPESAATPSGAPLVAAAPKPPVQTMTVDRPIRSGQQIYARDADLVVIGQVSPGAEVIADGNIHVYGSLQGRAIAGARGRRDVGIFALALEAELIAVSGIYKTFEDGLPQEQRGRPVRVELDPVADKLTVRPL